jgi:hypothetical protein
VDFMKGIGLAGPHPNPGPKARNKYTKQRKSSHSQTQATSQSTIPTFVVWYTCFALWAPDWDGIAPSGVAIAMIIDRSRRRETSIPNNEKVPTRKPRQHPSPRSQHNPPQRAILHYVGIVDWDVAWVCEWELFRCLVYLFRALGPGLGKGGVNIPIFKSANVSGPWEKLGTVLAGDSIIPKTNRSPGTAVEGGRCCDANGAVARPFRAHGVVAVECAVEQYYLFKGGVNIPIFKSANVSGPWEKLGTVLAGDTVPSFSHGPDTLADLKIGMLTPPLKR